MIFVNHVQKSEEISGSKLAKPKLRFNYVLDFEARFLIHSSRKHC